MHAPVLGSWNTYCKHEEGDDDEVPADVLSHDSYCVSQRRQPRRQHQTLQRPTRQVFSAHVIVMVLGTACCEVVCIIQLACHVGGPTQKDLGVYDQ